MRRNGTGSPPRRAGRRVAVGLRRSAATADELLTVRSLRLRPGRGRRRGRTGRPGRIGDRLHNAADRPWDEVVDRLALVLTHRIAAAAESAATRMVDRPARSVQLLEGDGVELWRHGASTTSALARERLLVWPGEIEQCWSPPGCGHGAWWQRHIPPAELTALVKRAPRRAGRAHPAGTQPPRHHRSTRWSTRHVGCWAGSPSSVVDADKHRFVARLDAVDPARVAAIERAADAVRALWIGRGRRCVTSRSSSMPSTWWSAPPPGSPPRRRCEAAAQAMRHLRGPARATTARHWSWRWVEAPGAASRACSTPSSESRSPRWAGSGPPPTDRSPGFPPRRRTPSTVCSTTSDIDDRHVHDRDPGSGAHRPPRHGLDRRRHREVVERHDRRRSTPCCGCSTRRSTTTGASTRTSSPRWRRTPSRPLFVLNKIDRVDPGSRGRCSPTSRHRSSPMGTRTRACSRWRSSPATGSRSGWRPWCSSSRPSSTTSGPPTASCVADVAGLVKRLAEEVGRLGGRRCRP